MKKTKKQQTTSSALRRSALLLAVILLLGVFTACGGLPASSEKEETTAPNYNWTLEDPPELPTMKMPDPMPDPIPEYDADIVEPEYTTRYAASSESDKYHRPSCHYVDNILPWNLIYFYSKSDARSAGYSPCSVCSP